MRGRNLILKIGYYLYAKTILGRLYHRSQLRQSRQKYNKDKDVFHGHSSVTTVSYGSVNVLIIPLLEDNYCYAVYAKGSTKVVLIDPCDSVGVAKCLDLHQLEPGAVLTTHKHWDHCGANAELKRKFPEIDVCGSSIDRPYGTSRFLEDNEKFTFESLEFDCLLTPGHTHGHMIFRLNGAAHGSPDLIFTGDLLFVSGCGKIFEGKTVQMLESLDLISSFADDALIFPGHEYALANIRFAESLADEMPDIIADDSLQTAIEYICSRRCESLPTCPSTLAKEKSYNPFLRTAEPSLLRGLGLNLGDFQEFLNLTSPPKAIMSVLASSDGALVAVDDKIKFADEEEVEEQEVEVNALEEKPKEDPIKDTTALSLSISTISCSSSAAAEKSKMLDCSSGSSATVDVCLRVKALKLLRRKKEAFRFSPRGIAK